MSLRKPIDELSADMERNFQLISTFKRTSVLYELQKKSRDEEELQTTLEKYNQDWKRLRQLKKEYHKNYVKGRELRLSFDSYLKEEDVKRAIQKTESKRKEVLQKCEELDKLKKEKAAIIQWNTQLKLNVQSFEKYKDVLEQLVKLTMLKDVHSLADYMNGLHNLKKQLSEREREAQHQADEMKKELTSLNDRHQLLQLQRNNELSQLKNVLDDALSEALVWERKWNHIQETAAKKILHLGQIKMATINLFEMAGGIIEEEDSMDMNATEKQLEKIKMFIQEYSNIVGHKNSSEIDNHGLKSEKRIKAHSKK